MSPGAQEAAQAAGAVVSYAPKDYVPIRRGPIYCAPFCGGNCTYVAFKDATAFAKKLCKKLGSGWKPDVHENLGWHCAVRAPLPKGMGLRVCVSVKHSLKTFGPVTGYIAFLYPFDDDGGGWSAHGRTAGLAIAEVVTRFRNELSSYVKLDRALQQMGWRQERRD
jgi:hypothetical protein